MTPRLVDHALKIGEQCLDLGEFDGVHETQDSVRVAMSEITVSTVRPSALNDKGSTKRWVRTGKHIARTSSSVTFRRPDINALA